MADIVRRDPFRQMMERFFDEPFFREPSTFPRSFGVTSEEGTLPLDVYEQDQHLVVEASVPGFAKEDIDVRVEDGVLSIRAKRDETREERNGTFYRRERSWGAVSRRVALPGIVKDAPVEAELKHGVLRLRIPLPQKVEPKQIEIKGE